MIMAPDEVPAELVAMLNVDAGKAHSRTGPVLASLARVLTRYDEIQHGTVAANLASLNEIVMELVDAASSDPAFSAMVRKTLGDHSRALGFTFQGS